jgi:hypothetical protein
LGFFFFLAGSFCVEKEEMVEVVVAEKVAEDDIAEGVGPECVAAETAWVVVFSGGGDVAREVGFYAAFTVFG